MSGRRSCELVFWISEIEKIPCPFVMSKSFPTVYLRSKNAGSI